MPPEPQHRRAQVEPQRTYLADEFGAVWPAAGALPRPEKAKALKMGPILGSFGFAPRPDTFSRRARRGCPVLANPGHSHQRSASARPAPRAPSKQHSTPQEQIPRSLSLVRKAARAHQGHSKVEQRAPARDTAREQVRQRPHPLRLRFRLTRECSSPVASERAAESMPYPRVCAASGMILTGPRR